MTTEIYQRLAQFIQREEYLLAQLTQIKESKDDISTELGKELFILGAKEVLGRTGGKFVRKALTADEKRRIETQEAQIEYQHQNLVVNIQSYLSGVSENKRNLSEPNSTKFVQRIQKAQDGTRVKTRINSTIKAIKYIKSKNLIFNHEIPVQAPKEILLPGGTPFTGYVELKNILGSVTDYVKIIDPYINADTLERLLAVPDNIPIMFLSENTGGKNEKRLLRSCRDFLVEKPNFNLKKCKGLHDRYIITKSNGWTIGSSLKDFGKKMSSISPLSNELKKEVEKTFDQLWNESKSLI